LEIWQIVLLEALLTIAFGSLSFLLSTADAAMVQRAAETPTLANDLGQVARVLWWSRSALRAHHVCDEITPLVLHGTKISLAAETVT